MKLRFDFLCQRLQITTQEITLFFMEVLVLANIDKAKINNIYYTKLLTSTQSQ